MGESLSHKIAVMEKVTSDNKVTVQKDGRFLRGFTLIELLVVIAIIALLLAILMPSLQKVQRSSKAVVCRAHLKSWAKVFIFSEENTWRIEGLSGDVFNDNNLIPGPGVTEDCEVTGDDGDVHFTAISKLTDGAGYAFLS